MEQTDIDRVGKAMAMLITPTNTQFAALLISTWAALEKRGVLNETMVRDILTQAKAQIAEGPTTIIDDLQKRLFPAH